MFELIVTSIYQFYLGPLGKKIFLFCFFFFVLLPTTAILWRMGVFSLVAGLLWNEVILKLAYVAWVGIVYIFTGKID